MHDPMDLLLPKTTGAFLAEEWSIDPYTPLPSFLEMKFMQDAGRSGREALQVAYELVLQKCSTMLQETNTENRFVAHVKRSAMALISVLKRYGLEWRCFMLYLLERHCLRISSAPLAETVYGGKRAILVREKEGNHRKRIVPMDRTNATRLALALALGPYFNEKLELVLQHQSVFGVNFLSWKPSHRRIFEILVRLLRFGAEAGNLFCQWRFLVGKSFHFDLVSLCLGMVVRRQTQQDQTSLVQPPPSNSSNLPTSSPGLSQTTRNVVMAAASLALTVSWLTQMRVTWMEHQQARRRLSSSPEIANDLPPPPHVKMASSRPLTSHCPKCHGPWIEPVVAIPGNFLVFCRACLDPEIASSKKIVRLFEPHASGINHVQA